MRAALVAESPQDHASPRSEEARLYVSQDAAEVGIQRASPLPPRFLVLFRFRWRNDALRIFHSYSCHPGHMLQNGVFASGRSALVLIRIVALRETHF